MANYSIIGGDGKEYGPIADADLRQWIAEGRINAQTKVRAEGASEWKLLSELSEFAAQPQNPASPPLSTGLPLVKAKTSVMAVISLVLGILGMFTCGLTALFGLIFGIIAMVKISNSQGALRGRGLALAGTIVSGVFLLLLPILAAMLLPALAAAKQKAQQINCMNNEKQLALAVKIYSGDNTNHFPSAATWCDSITSYVGAEKVFKCPAVTSASRCGYAFNDKLDGLDESAVNPQTVLIFESDGGWNAHGGPELLSGATRHGHNSRAAFVVAFADGHVEAVPLSRISSLRWNP